MNLNHHFHTLSGHLPAIQIQSIAHLLDRENILLPAPTGSGKTETAIALTIPLKPMLSTHTKISKKRKKFMIANPQYHQKMTAEEYLEWEAKQELRHEYIDGEILAMTGGSIPHNKIYLSFYRTLYPHLRQRNCEAYVSDVKVQANKNSRYFYPDLVVTCDPEDLKSSDFIQHPKVIIEVLSPGTASYDRGEKFKYYRQIPSLQEYVLADSESISVEVYHRGEGKMWHYYEYAAGDAIALESIEFECPIELLYEGVSFAQE